MAAHRPAISIRTATAEDDRIIAQIHVRGWQWAYRGLLRDDFLDALSVERRQQAWREFLSDPTGTQRVWVADQEGLIVGFAATGPAHDADSTPETGEIVAIYLEPDVVGTGVGRALFGRAVEGLREQGFKTATLWVLTANDRARRFYEIAGWRTDGTKTEAIQDVQLEEVRYRIDFG